MNLREERNKRYLSKSDLARMTGLDISTIRNIENGTRNCGDVTLYRIEKALGIEADISPLRRMRLERGMSLSQVQSKVFINQATLSNYERDDSKMKVYALRRLCELYECEAKDIIGF